MLTARSTPDRFRLARLVLVVSLLLAALSVGLAADGADRATEDIDTRIEPVSAGALGLYRSLAEADAALVADLLAAPTDPTRSRDAYDDSLADAAKNLARTGSRAGPDAATADRVEDVAVALPEYAALAQQARSSYHAGGPDARDVLQRTDLMRSVLLPTAEAVRVRESAKLEDAYAEAASVPVAAIALTVVALVCLAVVQLFLYRATRRVLTAGTLVATTAMLAMGVWWSVAAVVAAGHLEASWLHLRVVTDALGPGQVAAAQARAAEGLALIFRDDASDEDYTAYMEILARGDGAGGALGAARALAPDPESEANVDAALAATRGYLAAHARVRAAVAAGDYDSAVRTAVGDLPDGSARAFTGLDAALTTGLDHEQRRFDAEIAATRAWRTGLVVGVALLGAVAVIGAAWGLNERLAEYR